MGESMNADVASFVSRRVELISGCSLRIRALGNSWDVPYLGFTLVPEGEWLLS
jgi:hypothetical protein